MTEISFSQLARKKINFIGLTIVTSKQEDKEIFYLSNIPCYFILSKFSPFSDHLSKSLQVLKISSTTSIYKTRIALLENESAQWNSNDQLKHSVPREHITEKYILQCKVGYADFHLLWAMDNSKNKPVSLRKTACTWTVTVKFEHKFIPSIFHSNLPERRKLTPALLRPNMSNKHLFLNN